MSSLKGDVGRGPARRRPCSASSTCCSTRTARSSCRPRSSRSRWRSRRSSRPRSRTSAVADGEAVSDNRIIGSARGPDDSALPAARGRRASARRSRATCSSCEAAQRRRARAGLPELLLDEHAARRADETELFSAARRTREGNAAVVGRVQGRPRRAAAEALRRAGRRARAVALRRSVLPAGAGVRGGPRSVLRRPEPRDSPSATSRRSASRSATC